MYKLAKELVRGNRLEMSSIERMCFPGLRDWEYQGDYEYAKVDGIHTRLNGVVEVTLRYWVAGGDEIALPPDLVVEVVDDNDVEPDWTHDMHGEVVRAHQVEDGDQIDVGPILALHDGRPHDPMIVRVRGTLPNMFYSLVAPHLITNGDLSSDRDPDLWKITGRTDEGSWVQIYVHYWQAFKKLNKED